MSDAAPLSPDQKCIKPGLHGAIFKKSFRIVLVRLYEHDDHDTLWDLSRH